MKLRNIFSIILLFSLILGFFLVLQGCDLLPVTIEERIQKFEDHLNTADRDTIFTEHFHPDADNAWASAAPWDTSAFAYANHDFSFSLGSPVDNFDGTYTVTGTVTHLGGTYSVEFLMKKLDKNWYIRTMDYDGGHLIT